MTSSKTINSMIEINEKNIPILIADGRTELFEVEVKKVKSNAIDNESK